MVLPLPKERTALIEDEDHRSRLLAKYDSLLLNLHYKAFLSLALEMLAAGNHTLLYYKLFRKKYIEIAIWLFLCKGRVV